VGKTEYSEDELPVDPDFAAILLAWKRKCDEQARMAVAEGKTPQMGLDLVFPSPVTGRHNHAAPIQQDYIRPAGWCLLECPNAEPASAFGARKTG
jgi:hypothetical protein